MGASKRIMIVAGEASGDAQAALLVRSMQSKHPTLGFYGVGGERMRAAGVDTIVDASALSIMGFTEALRGLGRAWRCYRLLRAELRSTDRPELLILVDFPEFNLILARAARAAGVPVFYYVGPQVWAWRRGRLRKIAERVTRMVVLFPFEEELYRRQGVDAHFVGHPLAESVRPSRPPAETRRLYGIEEDTPLVALLPGSRASEVRAHLPVMLEVARLLRREARFAIARAPGMAPEVIEEVCGASGNRDVAVVSGDTYNLLSASAAAAVTSGTATVECALIGVPMVVVYRMSRVSYLLARLLVHAPFIAMPNIILGRAVVPELIQAQASASAIAERLRPLLGGPAAAEVRGELARVREALVLPGAAGRAADLALEILA